VRKLKIIYTDYLTTAEFLLLWNETGMWCSMVRSMSRTNRSRLFYWRDINCIYTQSVFENSKSSNEETYVTLFSFAAIILGHCVET
jgi:hypothetical protein